LKAAIYPETALRQPGFGSAGGASALRDRRAAVRASEKLP
jgi:hypothetical protein